MKQKIDELIKNSMLAKDVIRTRVLRAIKTEFMKVETAKNAKELDEVTVLRKMKKDREESASTYLLANRLDLASEESKEADILAEFLPNGPSEDDIRKNITIVLAENNISLEQKNMGIIMKSIKAKLPTVDMKIVNDIIKSLI